MNFLQTLTDLPPTDPSCLTDLDRRYQGTILQVINRETREEYLVYYIRYSLDSTSIECYNDLGSRIYIHLMDPVDIVPFLPPVGYFMWKGRAYYLVKKPERQWKRSFCFGMYSVLRPRVLNSTQPLAKEWMVNLCMAIKSKEYTHLDDLPTTTKETGYVLNAQFYIDCTTDKYTLYFRKIPVGYVNLLSKEITITQVSVTQEIQDLFKRTGVTKWILK